MDRERMKWRMRTKCLYSFYSYMTCSKRFSSISIRLVERAQVMFRLRVLLCVSVMRFDFFQLVTSSSLDLVFVRRVCAVSVEMRTVLPKPTSFTRWPLSILAGMEFYKNMQIGYDSYLSTLLLFAMKTDYPRCLKSSGCPGTFCKW